MRIIRAGGRLWLGLESMRSGRVWLIIFLAGIAVRMGISLFTGTYLSLGRFEMERAALSLARDGTLANPYLIPTGPTAHVAPLYPVLLAAVFRLFGTGPGAELVKNLLSSAAPAAQYAFLPVFCPVFGINRRAGLLAAVFGAVLPLKYSTETMGDWEAPFAGLALLLMMYSFGKDLQSHNFGLRSTLRNGLGWGVSFLLAPALMSVFGALLALGYAARFRSGSRAFLAYAAGSVLLAGLCLSPWAWRNQRQLGAPIFTRSNFGLELRMANNDLAGPLELENFRVGVYHAFHPFNNMVQARAVRDVGEVAFNKACFEQAVGWIKTHPRRFLELTLQRVWYTWFPQTKDPRRDFVLWLVAGVGALGLTRLWQRDRIAALLLLTCLASYTAVYSLLQVSVRYRYPIDWILLLAASYAAERCYNRLFAHSPELYPLREQPSAR